jgi:hypothetical protein
MQKGCMGTPGGCKQIQVMSWQRMFTVRVKLEWTFPDLDFRPRRESTLELAIWASIVMSLTVRD